MSIDLEEQREHELAVKEARKLGLENDPEVSKYLCTGKAKVAPRFLNICRRAGSRK